MYVGKRRKGKTDDSEKVGHGKEEGGKVGHEGGKEEGKKDKEEGDTDDDTTGEKIEHEKVASLGFEKVIRCMWA